MTAPTTDTPRDGAARRNRAILRVGVALVLLGLLLLGFWSYLLWGTALSEHQGQRRLSDQLAREFPSRDSRPSAPPSSTPARKTVAFRWPALGNGDAVARLEIPRIGLSQVVVEGTDAFDLREGPGHYPGTPLPGQRGNAAIAGHRTTYARPFDDLNELKPGDLIILSAGDRTWRYTTTATFVVRPTDLAVAEPLRAPGSWLTLTTCTPRYSAAMRLVVRARLASTVTSAAAKRASPIRSDPIASRAFAAITPDGGSGWQIAGWSALVCAMALSVRFSWRILRRPWWRWAAALFFTAIGLVGIWELFGAIAFALPAGF